MAAIVLVHGIGQEQLSADTLEKHWVPDLVGGIRKTHPELADRIGPAGDVGVRMAFYGDRFLRQGAQGVRDSTGLSDAELELMEHLAEAWLHTAAEHAPDPRDRREAVNELHRLGRGEAGAQGPKAVLRPAMNGLARIRWLAPVGVGVAGRFVWRALTQVSRYLADDTIRSFAQQQVLDAICPDTRIVIGHSLGSVVAYEALHHTTQPTALLTLGSPLGLRTVIYDKLQPRPPHVPALVTRWDNLVDTDDLIAAHLDLAPYFPPAPGATVIPRTNSTLDNGAQPHNATHYLTKRATGLIVSDALRGR
ncbi:hypothetical protein [Gordonia hongkongensis]|uniref:Alpha/beta hydrolase n=1 Tax=Gordonia hongkongensis TaxID=1701090 RepID=A0ABT6C158_9ACTN|nr:hypothetical protein [Gordonia hongkongensis]MDF6103941.1 hypothetical protein [Gordonia hongkongensis]